MPFHSLLTEKLISVRYESGVKEKLTLPGVLGKLSREDIESFAALQPHQEQAWYCFLVQLAAMAMHESGEQTIEGDENEWAARLRTLTEDFPKDEPWCMVVEDLAKPAFMQTPISRDEINDYNEEHTFFEADLIDIPVTAKNHDLKESRIAKANQENWLYALVNLQTMQEYSGPFNFGIARMNGGKTSRPLVSLTPKEIYRDRFKRDIQILIRTQIKTAENYSYDLKDGKKLLWLYHWDGKQQLVLRELNPFFVEICRRVRFFSENGRLFCKTALSGATRIAAKELKGNTGDPWTPIDIVDEPKSLTLTKDGYTYRKIHELLFENRYKKPPCLEAQKDDPSELLFLAQCMVRQENKTHGFHERKILIPGKIRFMFDTVEGQTNLSKISKQMITDAGDFTNKVFRMAIYSLLQPDKEKFDFKDERPQKWSKRLDHEIDRIFFNKLWQFAEGDNEENRKAWLSELKIFGENLLHQAFDGVPLPSARKYKTISSAEGRFNRSFYNAFPFIKPQSTGGAHG